MAADTESADLKGLAEQMREMRRAMEQLAEVTRLLSDAVRRAPVHLDVEHLQIERVEFNLDGIDVDDLSGELNIGVTAMQKSRGPAPQPIWPPKKGEVGRNGQEPTDRGEPGGAGDAPG